MPPTQEVRSAVLTGSPPSRRRRVAAVATPLIVLALAAGGCSGDDGAGGSGDGSSSAAPSSPPLATTATVREVTGKLSKHRRHAVLEEVTAVVDGWWDAAYLSGGDDDPFPGFTAGAAELAQRDRSIMTRAAYPDGASDPVAVRRSVALDILAVHGRAAGVTASVALGVRTSGATERVVAVRGLVELSRLDGRWRIFGYDVTATPRVPGKAGKHSHRKDRS
ncbi:MAG TPA: hypothetical protein VNS55_13230 [Nocardioides sp.]|nr:hypothetical protein [Nocardioides sp.]